MEDNKVPKIFNDPVHGHIEMPPLLVKIINTPEFQRLRNIKQLGGGYYVFPGASHNRFEHSIGVAHLAGQLVKTLNEKAKHSVKSKRDQDKEEKLRKTVQIAGLCHDLGHGPFSHAFEKFMKDVKPDLKWKHEEQSVKMFEEIIKKPHIKKSLEEEGLKDEHIDVIKELICPTKDIPQSENFVKFGLDKPYLYQIVANSKTGIDVDKMDYFVRDCHHLGMKCNFSYERYMKFARVCNVNGEEQICMRDKEAMNMYELFHVRNLLHHNAYQHRVTKAVELMIMDALKEADKTLKISDAVKKPEEFLTLTDNILQKIQHSSGPELEGARKIIERLSERKLYKFIGEKIFEAEQLKHLDDKTKQEMLKVWLASIKEKNDGQPLNSKEFEAVHINFTYGMKERNPIDELRFYRKDNPDKAVQLSKNEVSNLLPEKFAESKVMVFYKGENKAVEVLAKKHINTFWSFLLPSCSKLNFKLLSNGLLLPGQTEYFWNKV